MKAITFSTVLIHKTDIAKDVFIKSDTGHFLDTCPLCCYNISMDTKMKQAVAQAAQTLDLPKYNRLPNMGLYLEQAVKYINLCLAPLGCGEITGSMVRNYVKMGLVSNPIKKQYYADQLAHLIPITLLKQVMPLEQISLMFRWQQQVYTDEVAYNYFIMELENILYTRFGLREELAEIGTTESVEKEMLRSAITAVCHVFYVNACMQYLQQQKA